MDSYLIGIDSGGTSCRVVLCDQTGRVLEKCTVPGHNPNADGFDALEQSLSRGLSAVLEKRGGLSAPLDAVHLGAAGGEGGNRARLEAMLRRLLPNARALSVSSDALIALSAGLGRKDGGVLIAGTGTVGCPASAAGAIWPMRAAPAGIWAGTASGPPWPDTTPGCPPPPSPPCMRSIWA